MNETLPLRALAITSLALSALVAWSLVRGGSEQGWKQALAKAALALLLTWMARLAWKRPAGAPARIRRRVLKLLAVLAHPELQREWAESSPSTDLAEALLSDWRRAIRVAPRDLEAAFTWNEVADVRSLAADIETLVAQLPAGPGAAAHPAWQEIQQRAAEAHSKLAPRPTGA